jgi:uncharacterized protein (TIGR02117 family)
METLIVMSLKKTIRFIFRLVLFFVGFIGLYLLSAWVLARISLKGETVNDRDVSIYILTNGVHTDFVVPAKSQYIDWTKKIPYSNTIAEDTTKRYLAMGWGDKGFYLQTPTWADLKASVAFKAATGLSTTAIHATYHDTLHPGDSCRKIQITRGQYQRLINYIVSSFQKDRNGAFINIKTNANYGDSDAFYEANGSYSMFHTCNTWVNTGLRTSGLKNCLWTPFDTGLFLLFPQEPGN